MQCLHRLHECRYVMPGRPESRSRLLDESGIVVDQDDVCGHEIAGVHCYHQSLGLHYARRSSPVPAPLSVISPAGCGLPDLSLDLTDLATGYRSRSTARRSTSSASSAKSTAHSRI